MTNDFNLNNNQIKNVKDASNNQDAVTLKQVNEGVASIALQNRQYTDKKMGESHITSHENSKMFSNMQLISSVSLTLILVLK